jgi:quinolinate synthase
MNKIEELKKKRNAIILAHNYQPPEIQDLADLCGDSLELAIRASKTRADVIVFCGVHFMAETASIVCPDKTVLLPAMDAGCPMADMVTVSALKEKIRELGDAVPVVTYVNSPASVKALSTVCCTSANSVKVVNSLDAKEVLMTPDRNLAAYTAGLTDKKVHFWEGCCPIHDVLRADDVVRARARHPDAAVMAHPECRTEVLDLADVVLSTSGMIRYARESEAASFLVATENGLLYALKKACPEKSFYPVSEKMICPDMKRITPELIADCLENMAPEVKVPVDVQQRALGAVEKMLALK